MSPNHFVGPPPLAAFSTKSPLHSNNENNLSFGTLVGLAISFASPTFAQQKDTADPPVVQQRDLLGVPNALSEFDALGIKMDEAFNNNDAGALAALFTEDAVLVASDGMFFGRQAARKGMQHVPAMAYYRL